MDMGPDHHVADSGPEDDEYSSSHLTMPVTWSLTVEAEASTELDVNLAFDLTTVTGVKP